MSYLKFAPRILYKSGGTPLYFVFFVTENCNAHCRHCLLGQRTEPVKGELTIDEIEKVSASMGDMLFFTPTGGEPFLRKDLSEIVKIFRTNNHAANVGIPSNGSLTDRVVEQTERMLKENPGIDLHIDISIDGIGDRHDEIRGMPGLFDRAVRTYHALRELEKHYPDFSCCVQITVSALNHDHVLDLYKYLGETVGVNTVFTLLTRGDPADPVTKQFDIARYEELHRALERDNKARILSGYYKMPFSDVLNAKRIVRPRIISRTVRENRQQLPCYAGVLGGNMFSKGQVGPCEVRPDREIGNVRDFDYDFRKLWHSARADEMRRDIRDNKCFCTYECFLTFNILFNPLVLPQVFVEYLNLKAAKIQHRISPQQTGKLVEG